MGGVIASPLLMAAALLISVAAITLVREGAMIDVCLETYCQQDEDGLSMA
jgi:hypothetical protein